MFSIRIHICIVHTRDLQYRMLAWFKFGEMARNGYFFKWRCLNLANCRLEKYDVITHTVHVNMVSKHIAHPSCRSGKLCPWP